MMVLPLFACEETPEETTTKAPEETTAPGEKETTDEKTDATTEAESTSESGSESSSESGSETTETDFESTESSDTETVGGETTEETTEVPVCEHTEAEIPAVAPTCEATGLTAGKKCSKCCAVLVEQEVVSAKGHAWDEGKITKEPTCEAEGVKTFICKNDESHTKTEAIDAKGHTPVVDAAVAPTCEATGLTEGSHCGVCSAVITAQETVAALGHAWDEGKITTEPTCEGKGVKTFTCANDASHTYTEEVDSIGHAWDEGNVTTEPTCEAEGVKSFTCRNDASHTKTETVSKADHTWVDATYETPKTCSVCGVTEGGCLEINHDNVFTAADIFAAYKANIPENFEGELVTENGVTFFRATATAATSGKLVLNSGKNTVSGVGKYFVIVYRNKTASISRFNMQLNSAGKTDGSGGAAPCYSISKSESWQAVYFSTSNPVDLTNGAGYIALDLFSTNNSGNVVTRIR